MTEKDAIIQDQRRELYRLTDELRDAKAMLHRLSRYVPDDILASIALEMSKTQPKPTEVDEEFWRD